MGFVLWITGLPGSGKSTVAATVKEKIADAVILRMDEIRKIVTPAPTYSDTEREYIYRALVYTAKMLHELGHNVIIDATGNRKAWRQLARELIPGFREIYLKCPVEVCMEREKKRQEKYAAPPEIYEKGKKGWPVPGVSVPYEESVKPELTIDTEKESPEDVAESIMRIIKEQL